MIVLQNLHTHSTFCDGKDTPEETVLRAIELGFDSIGFSEHAPAHFSASYERMRESNLRYREEIARLKNDLNARAYLKELDEYRVINANEKLYQLCYDATGLKANKQNQTAVTSPDKKWLVESTGEMHHYYIKNYNGLYISDYTLNGNTLCNGNSQSTATVFKANYLDDGRIYFTTKNEGAYLTLNSDYKVVCSTEFIDSSLWTIVRVTANNTGIEEVETGNAEERTIYDLTGRRIERITAPGIYIIDGKKVMVN